MPYYSKAVRDRMRARIAQRVRAGEPCALCGQPIDLSVPWPEPQCFVVDHVVATNRGGADDYDNANPAHNACNRAKSDHTHGTVKRNSGALEP